MLVFLLCIGKLQNYFATFQNLMDHLFILMIPRHVVILIILDKWTVFFALLLISQMDLVRLW